MISFRRQLLLNLYKLSDVTILIVSLLAASSFNAIYGDGFTITEFLAMRIKVVNLALFLIMALAWYLVFHRFHLYRSRRLKGAVHEWQDVLKATTVGSLFMLLAGLAFRFRVFGPYFVLPFWLSSSVLTVSFRATLRYVLKKIRLHGRNLRLILIAGTNRRAYEFADMLEEKKELGFRLIGFIDNDIYIPRKNVELLGKLDDFPRIIQERIVDEVFIALPIKSHYEEIQRIVQKAEENGIPIRFLWQFFDTSIAVSRSEEFEHLPTVMITSGPQDGWSYLAKQVIDRMLAFLMIVATAPVMLIAALAIRFSSPGPVLFSQKRLGRNRRGFHLFKFRTMVLDAEEMQPELEDLNEMDGPVFKIRNDPRITGVGRWLRRWSIDELPQLFNVLKGDMSLVGPRPLPLRDYDGFNQDWQRRRFSILPGITCTWQVNGRNAVSFEDWIKMDMEYIDNWKLSNDIKILLRTIPAVFKAQGM
jgi:exopolysaccharide biosynthesis polyprenyl glycosylphosphotransferase